MAGVPGARTPVFLAVIRIVSGEHIAASDQEFAVVRDDGAKGFKGFLVGFAGPHVFPEGLAGLGLHGEDEGRVVRLAAAVNGFVALQHGQVKLVLIECGRGGEGPLKGEVAVVLLDVTGPEFVALHVEPDEVAVAVKEHHGFTVGHG